MFEYCLNLERCPQAVWVGQEPSGLPAYPKPAVGITTTPVESGLSIQAGDKSIFCHRLLTILRQLQGNHISDRTRRREEKRLYRQTFLRGFAASREPLFFPSSRPSRLRVSPSSSPLRVLRGFARGLPVIYPASAKRSHAKARRREEERLYRQTFLRGFAASREPLSSPSPSLLLLFFASFAASREAFFLPSSPPLLPLFSSQSPLSKSTLAEGSPSQPGGVMLASASSLSGVWRQPGRTAVRR